MGASLSCCCIPRSRASDAQDSLEDAENLRRAQFRRQYRALLRDLSRLKRQDEENTQPLLGDDSLRERILEHYDDEKQEQHATMEPIRVKRSSSRPALPISFLPVSAATAETANKENRSSDRHSSDGLSCDPFSRRQDRGSAQRTDATVVVRKPGSSLSFYHSLKQPPGGRKGESLRDKIDATLGNGDLRDVVNIVDLYNTMIIIYSTMQEFCTELNCPVMTAGVNYEYRWPSCEPGGRPVQCSAPEYIERLMNWVGDQIDDPR
eukprot:gene3692-4629_t